MAAVCTSLAWCIPSLPGGAGAALVCPAACLDTVASLCAAGSSWGSCATGGSCGSSAAPAAHHKGRITRANHGLNQSCMYKCHQLMHVPCTCRRCAHASWGYWLACAAARRGCHPVPPLQRSEEVLSRHVVRCQRLLGMCCNRCGIIYSPSLGAGGGWGRRFFG